MRRPNEILLLAVCLTCSVSLAAAATETTEHLLFRQTHEPGGLSVAFVGDGFDEKHLAWYGVAVDSFVKKLRKRDVFDRHWSRFNFYRIDVVDKTGVTENLCPGDSFNKLTAEPLYGLGQLDPPVGGTTEKDLHVQRCWDGGSPLLLYTSELDAAIELAAQIPDLKVVVIVANARLASGGAQLLLTQQQTTVAVVGAHVSPAEEDPNKWSIDELAVTTLTHELGHALGLLDEYGHLHGTDAPTFQECRNVWKPNVTPQWPGSPTWPADEKPIPWHGVLTHCCSPQTMVRCQSHKPDGSCVLQDVETAEAYCSFVPRSGNPHLTCYPPPECSAFPGAWEGAFYSSTDYYRATDACRMLSMGVDQKFCDACRQYLDILLENYGAGADLDGPWPEERCDSPACPTPVPALPDAPTDVFRSDGR